MNSKKGSIFFPWVESINSRVYVAGFSGNINVHIDVMKNLFCEVSPEIMKIVAERDLNRAERLFQLLHHYVFSFHMCNITRNKEIKLTNKTFLLLVSCLVDLHIFLCRRDPGSDHLEDCIRDMYLFIGTDVSSLWDVLLHCKLLKKKHSAVVVPIMKRVMQKVPTVISSPEEYMKMVLLMRQWKMFCNLKTDKFDILNLAAKVRPPNNLFNWLATRFRIETPPKLSFSTAKKLFAKHFIHKKCPKGFCKKLQEVLRRGALDAAGIHFSTDEYLSNYAWNNNQTSLISTDAQQLAADQNDIECGGFLIDCSGLENFQEQEFEVPEYSSFEGKNAGKKSKKRRKKRNGIKEDYDASENCADETLSEVGVKRKKSAFHNRDSDIHSSSEDDLDRCTWHPDQSGLFFIDGKVSNREHNLESADTLYESKGFDGILGNQDFEDESAKKKSGKRLKKRARSENLVSMPPVEMEYDVERSDKSLSHLLSITKDNANEAFPGGHPVDPYSFGDTAVKTSQINEEREDNENLIKSSVYECSVQPSLPPRHSSKKLKGKKIKKTPPCESGIQFHVTETETVDENLVKNKLPDPNVDFCSEHLKAHGSTKKQKRKKSMVVEEVVLLDYENSAGKTITCKNELSEVSFSNSCGFTPDRKLKKMKKKLKNSNLSFELEDSCNMFPSELGKENESYSVEVDKESCIATSKKKKHRKKNYLSGNYERVEEADMSVSVNLHKEDKIDHSHKTEAGEITIDDILCSEVLPELSNEKESQIRKRKRDSTPDTCDVWDVKVTESFVEICKHDSSEPCQKNRTQVVDGAIRDEFVLPGKKKKKNRLKSKNSSTRENHDSVDAENSLLANDKIVYESSFECSGQWLSANSSFNSSYSESNLEKPKKRKKNRKHELVPGGFDSSSQNKDIHNDAMEGASENTSKDCQSRVSISDMESSVDNSHSHSNWEISRKKKKHGLAETTDKLENEKGENYGNDFLHESHSVHTLPSSDIGVAKGRNIICRNDSLSPIICASDESFSTVEKNNDPVNESGNSNSSSILSVADEENIIPSSSSKSQFCEGVNTLERASPLITEGYDGNGSLDLVIGSRGSNSSSILSIVDEQNTIPSSSKRRSDEGIKALERAAPLITKVCTKNDSLDPIIESGNSNSSSILSIVDEENTIPSSSKRKYHEGIKALERATPLITQVCTKNDSLDPIIGSGNSNSSSILGIADEENTIPSSSKRRSDEGIKALERAAPLITKVCTKNDSLDPIIESGNSNSSSVLGITDEENTIPSSSKRRSDEGINALEKAAPLITELYTGNNSLGGNDLEIKDTSEIHEKTECDDSCLGVVETLSIEPSAVVDVHISPRATLQANYHETPSSINMQKEHDEICNSLVSTSPVSLTRSTSVALSPNKRSPMSRRSPSKKESFISENDLKTVASYNLSENGGQVNDSKNSNVELTGSPALPFQSPRKVTNSKPSGNVGKTCPDYEKSPDIWLPFQSEDDNLSSECVMYDSKAVSVEANEIDGTPPNKDVNSCLATLESSSEGESSSPEINFEKPEKLKTTDKAVGSFITEHKSKSKRGESFVKENAENVSGLSESNIPDSEWDEAIGIWSSEDPTVTANKSFSGTSDIDGDPYTADRSSNSCGKQNVSGDCDNVDTSKQTLMPVVLLSPLKDSHVKSVNLPQESDHKSATPSIDVSPKPSLVLEPSDCKDSHSVSSSSLDQSNKNSRTPESHMKEKVYDDSGSDSPNRSSSDNHARNEETGKLRSFEKSDQVIKKQANRVVDDVNKSSKKSSPSPKSSSKMEKSIQQEDILHAKEEGDKVEEGVLKFSSVEIPFLSSQAISKYKPCEENVFSRIAKRNSDLKVPPVLTSVMQKQESDMSPLRQSSRIRQKLEENQSSASGINNSLGISPLTRLKILQKDFGAKQQPSATKAKDSTSVFLSSSIVDSKKYLDFSDLKMSPQKFLSESKNLILRPKSKEDEKSSASPTKVSDHKSGATPICKSSPKKCAESPFSSWKSRLRKSGMKASPCQRSASKSFASFSATKPTNDDESSVEADSKCSKKKHEARDKPKKQLAKKQLAFNTSTSALDQSLTELCLKFSSCSRSPVDDRQRKKLTSEASPRSSSEDSGAETTEKSHNNMTPCRRIISDSDTSSSSENLPTLKDSVKKLKKSPSKASSHSSSEDSVIKCTRKSVDKTPRRIVSDSDSSSSSDVRSSAKRVPSRRLSVAAGKSASTSKTRLLNTPDEAKEGGYNLRPRRSIIMPSKLKV